LDKSVGAQGESRDNHRSREEGEGYKNPTSEGFDQATTEHPTDNAGSDTHTVDRSDGDESPDEANPEQARPAGGGKYDVGPLSGDEHTEQPVGVTEGDPEQGTTVVTTIHNGDPGFLDHPGLQLRPTSWFS